VPSPLPLSLHTGALLLWVAWLHGAASTVRITALPSSHYACMCDDQRAHVMIAEPCWLPGQGLPQHLPHWCAALLPACAPEICQSCPLIHALSIRSKRRMRLHKTRHQRHAAVMCVSPAATTCNLLSSLLFICSPLVATCGSFVGLKVRFIGLKVRRCHPMITCTARAQTAP